MCVHCQIVFIITIRVSDKEGKLIKKFDSCSNNDVKVIHLNEISMDDHDIREKESLWRENYLLTSSLNPSLGRFQFSQLFRMTMLSLRDGLHVHFRT